MRNILALVGAATVAFLALGWYLGWYQVSSTISHGQQSVNVSIDPSKITEDVKKGVERGGEIVDNLRDRPADAKPAVPSGPASSFFTPSSSNPPAPGGSSGGWKPIDGPKSNDDARDLNFRVPRN
jgi:hypothetical protein